MRSMQCFIRLVDLVFEIKGILLLVYLVLMIGTDICKSLGLPFMGYFKNLKICIIVEWSCFLSLCLLQLRAVHA
jgi:hypothetical protein